MHRFLNMAGRECSRKYSDKFHVSLQEKQNFGLQFSLHMFMFKESWKWRICLKKAKIKVMYQKYSTECKVVINL
jgi:hypothetical protein